MIMYKYQILVIDITYNIQSCVRLHCTFCCTIIYILFYSDVSDCCDTRYAPAPSQPSYIMNLKDKVGPKRLSRDFPPPPPPPRDSCQSGPVWSKPCPSHWSVFQRSDRLTRAELTAKLIYLIKEKEQFSQEFSWYIITTLTITKLFYILTPSLHLME